VPDPVLGPGDVTTLVSKALSSQVAHPEPLDVGFGNENWLLQLSSGQRFVAKFAPLSLEEKRRSGARAASLATEVGVPTPRLVYLGRAGERVLRVFEWVDGLAARTVVKDRHKAHALFFDLGRAVARLHGVDPGPFSSRLDGSSPTFARWADYVEYRLGQIRQRVEQHGGLTLEQFAKVSARASRLAQEISAVARPTLCHRDLHIDNLLVDDDGHLVAILDFDMAEVWDTAGEWFKMEWLLFPLATDGRQAFEASYGAFHPALPAWEKRKLVVDLLETANSLPNAVAEGWLEFGERARHRLDALLFDRNS
jgi:aminoglycoside phosphotransferase (APT) family kinase protein